MVKDSDECKEGIIEAAKDYKEGKGMYFSIGDLSSWDVVYDWHMEKTLEIEIETTGCTPDFQQECYNLFAKYKLKEIHGDNIFDKLKLGTDSLFKKKN